MYTSTCVFSGTLYKVSNVGLGCRSNSLESNQAALVREEEV